MGQKNHPHADLISVLYQHQYVLGVINECIEVSRVKKKAIAESIIISIGSTFFFWMSYVSLFSDQGLTSKVLGFTVFIALGILLLFSPLWTVFFRSFDKISINTEEDTFSLIKTNVFGKRIEKKFIFSELEDISIEESSINTDASAFEDSTRLYVKNIVCKPRKKKRFRLFSFQSKQQDNLKFVDEFYTYLKHLKSD